jgi:Fe-S cluster assembly ATP-binding protein
MNEHLTLKNIHAYIGEREVVRGVSLTLRPGELHILMGTNGSGKSSLVNSLMGHPKFSRITGRMVLGDEDILMETPDQKAKRGLFLSLQHLPSVEGITLAYFLHQVQKALRNSQQPIMEFYEEAKAKARHIGIPENLLDRPLNAGLSGGEKKQSEILQLALQAPKYAFLDEIDSGVDVDAMGSVWKGIEECRRHGTGIVLITHYPSILKSADPDAVHIMANGKIVKSGSAEIVSLIEREGFRGLVETA